MFSVVESSYNTKPLYIYIRSNDEAKYKMNMLLNTKNGPLWVSWLFHMTSDTCRINNWQIEVEKTSTGILVFMWAPFIFESLFVVLSLLRRNWFVELLKREIVFFGRSILIGFQIIIQLDNEQKFIAQQEIFLVNWKVIHIFLKHFF